MHLKEIKLYTAHLQELFYFYNEILGMNCNRSGNEMHILTRDSLLRFEESAANDDPYYHFAFNIPSNKIEEAYTWLTKRVKLLWIEDYKSYIADFSNWHAKSLYFIDPGGNIAEFISRSDMTDIVDEPFSAAHIRNVSEIGLVFSLSSFDQKTRQLLSERGLSYFIRQPPLDGFRAIGNDEGLFICVSEHRSWYPVKDKPAFIYPMQILVKTENTEFLLQS